MTLKPADIKKTCVVFMDFFGVAWFYPIIMKIIFLDFDGPISNYRTAMTFGGHMAFDPVAMQSLSHICAVSGARVVCTSVRTWAHSRESFLETRGLMEAAGFDIRHLHPEWSCRYDHGRREGHIKRFLSRHPNVTHYAIIDDDFVDLPNFVRIDQHNGILMAHFEAVAKLLDFDLGDVFEESWRQNDGKETEHQFRLELDGFDKQYNDAVRRAPKP